MIDSYIYGKVERISPEAPVPVVTVKKREKRLGGAANVALNVQALGATPVLCSVIGDDTDGKIFHHLLKKRDISSEGIITSSTRMTTEKERVISGSQHMLRIDSEMDTELNKAEEKLLLERIKKLILKTDVIIFEDYDKGAITKKIIKEIIALARDRNVPTVVDPKKRNFLNYHHATLFKPNLKELKDGLKIDLDHTNKNQLREAVSLLKNKLEIQNALITLSEKGIYIDAEKEHHFLPAHIRDISDVSGAGDTVISIAALGIALHLSPRLIAELSNLGGGLVCEHLGVVPIDKNSLYNEAKSHKLFDAYEYQKAPQ